MDVDVSKKDMLIDRMTTKHIEAGDDEEHRDNDNAPHADNDEDEADAEEEEVVVVRDEASGCVHYKRKAKFVVSTHIFTGNK